MQKFIPSSFHLFALSVLLIGVSANANPQQELLDLDFGKFELAKEEMGQLIQIGQSQGRLIIERDWQRLYDREKANEKPGEARAKKIQELIDRGFPVDRAGEWADRQLKLEAEILNRRDTPQYRYRALLATFAKFGKAVDANSHGSRGHGGLLLAHFSCTGHLGEAIVDQEFLKFVFTHDDSGDSQFIFQDVGDAFFFRFLNNDFLLDLNSNRKRTRLAVVFGDTAKVYVARDYAALAFENPEIIAQFLVPLWEKIGVEEPLSFADPDVISAAMEKLRATENDETKVMTLIDELESDSFSARELASNQLMEGHFKWEFLIRTLIENKELQLEAKSHVDRILSCPPETKAQDVVDSRNLLESAEVLVELLESASETDQPVVIRRLKLVTGNDFGNDVSAWKSSLKD